jgi:hypothetical protein
MDINDFCVYERGGLIMGFGKLYQEKGEKIGIKLLG